MTDPYLSNVVSILNPSDYADGEQIVDEIAGTTWVASGTAAISGGSIVFPGADDYIEQNEDPARTAYFSNSPDGSEWTIEFKLFPNTMATIQVLQDWRPDALARGMSIQTSGANKIDAYLADNSGSFDLTLSSTDTITGGTAFEVALTKAADGTYYLHLDGVFQTSGSLSLVLDLGSLGMQYGNHKDPGYSFDGALLRSRMTQGIARYFGADYTPEPGDRYPSPNDPVIYDGPVYPDTLPSPDHVNYSGVIDNGLLRSQVPSAQAIQYAQFNAPTTTFGLVFSMTNATYLEWSAFIEEFGYDWFEFNDVISGMLPQIYPTSTQRVRCISDVNYTKRGHDWLSVSVEVELIPGDSQDPLATLPDYDFIIAGTPASPSADWIIAGTPAAPSIEWIRAELYYRG